MLEQCSHVTCPTCGTNIPIGNMSRLGRKPLNISVNNVCDALQVCRDVTLAARKLGCSRGYIYKVLKSEGLVPRQVIEAKQKVGIL